MPGDVVQQLVQFGAGADDGGLVGVPLVIAVVVHVKGVAHEMVLPRKTRVCFGSRTINVWLGNSKIGNNARQDIGPGTSRC
nr:hypothetical protein GCM10020241_63320 [Streptoalloteichus tenebrarius]